LWVLIRNLLSEGHSYILTTVKAYNDPWGTPCFNVQHVSNVMAHVQKPRFGLSAKRTGPFKLGGGGVQFSGLLAAEVCASAVVMVVMLDTPCSEVQCKTTGYPLHSHVSPSLPLPCVTVCHHVSTEQYPKTEHSELLLKILFQLVFCLLNRT